MNKGTMLTTTELALYLNVPIKTIRHWHYSGTGPAAYKLGRRVMYRREEVDAWVDSRRKGPPEREASAGM